MKNFSTYLIDAAREFNKTIALVGGSYKPPTAGHLDMVQKYADKADEVKIIISDPKSAKSIRKTSLGTVITPEMSKKIWEIYLKRYGLKNVTVDISTEPSPITALYKYVDEHLKDVNVIFGVSTKGDDVARFKSAMKYYADNEHIHLIDPATTAVTPYTSSNGTAVSATDIRNNVDNPDVIRELLPSKLTDGDVQEVISILSTTDESESVSEASKSLLDEIEDIDVVVNDDVLKNARIAAYNVGQMVQKPDSKKEVPVNPKKFPTKAVDIIFPTRQLLVEVFLDTDAKQWDSDVIYGDCHMKLSPEQMGQFFKTLFYQKLVDKLEKSWPLSDKLYGQLFNGLKAKEMKVGLALPALTEGDDKKKSKEKKDDKEKKPEYTASGRKIVSFSDGQVSTKDAMFYCWPDPKDPFRASQWQDWKKVKPLCRARFKHGEHVYGLSLSTLGDDYDKRGFRGYDLTEQPPIQWLSKDENAQFMKLSIVDKFLRKCISRITEYVSMDPEDVVKEIGKPDEVTAKDVAKTQSCIRRTMNEVIKNKQIDSFSWK